METRGQDPPSPKNLKWYSFPINTVTDPLQQAILPHFSVKLLDDWTLWKITSAIDMGESFQDYS